MNRDTFLSQLLFFIYLLYTDIYNLLFYSQINIIRMVGVCCVTTTEKCLAIL